MTPTDDPRLAAIAAALSFDPTEDRDLEACARRLYAERDGLRTQLRYMTIARDNAVAAAESIAEELVAERLRPKVPAKEGAEEV